MNAVDTNAMERVLLDCTNNVAVLPYAATRSRPVINPDFGDGGHLNDIVNAVWTRKMNEIFTEN